MLKEIGDFIESWLRAFIIFITNYLPVKVIKDERGRPFLYRYHLFKWGSDGAGLCIHHFVLSDPERGYHDHPWTWGCSFILSGGYEERILKNKNSANDYYTVKRPRWTFNYLDGIKTYHRVMIPEGKDAWTLFAFGSRTKTWGMVSLDGKYNPMSTQISDLDGDWQVHAMKGLGVHSHLEHPGKVIATVDIIVIAEDKVLLIKRGKEPYKGHWAFPGGRIEQRDKDILAAAYRELKEETNLENVKLDYVKTIGNSTRDPRGFCLTNVFLAKLDKIPNGVRAGDDAVDYTWFSIYNLPEEMAFDHKEIFESIKI